MFESNLDFDLDDDSISCSFENSAKPKKRIQESSPNCSTVIKKTRVSGTEDVPAKIFKTPTFPCNAVKRKFPGPAGILPDRKDIDLSVLETTNFKDPASLNNGIPCSQSSLSVFQKGPWLKMAEEFESNGLADRYNIKWIKTRAGLNQLVNQKAPFLAAIIHNVECFDGKVPIVNVVLKDKTGEIEGTVIHSLYEEHGDNLIIGSVIVLKHFGVLTTGCNSNHYLTITTNNLVTIYTPVCEKTAVETDGNSNSDQNETVKRIQLQCLEPLFENSLITNKENIEQSKQVRKVEHNLPSLTRTSSTEPSRKQFVFKKAAAKTGIVTEENSSRKINTTVSCSQMSVQTTNEHSQIWQSVLEDVDADEIFGDF